jgi:Fe-S cluster assembly ATP-binding protein
MLRIKDLTVFAGDRKILQNVNLSIDRGKRTILMGPNGSGKSTVCKSVMGDSDYTLERGSITLDEEDVTLLTPDEKAKKGMFMVFQEPEDIDGLNVTRFLRATYSKLKGNVEDFSKRLEAAREEVRLNKDQLSKSLNVTASGGEKKKLEILQMLLFEPKYALIDEFDSGLDVDSVKKISGIINKSECGFLIVTHNPAVFKYLNVDEVDVIRDGKIIATGGLDLADKIEKQGFTWKD